MTPRETVAALWGEVGGWRTDHSRGPLRPLSLDEEKRLRRRLHSRRVRTKLDLLPRRAVRCSLCGKEGHNRRATHVNGRVDMPAPWVLCFRCRGRGEVEGVELRGKKLWKLPPGWIWIDGRGGLCHTCKPTNPDASLCPSCGSFMVRTGNCETCPECGLNGGCG